MKKILLSIVAVAAAACGSYSAAADATIGDTYKKVMSNTDIELNSEYILCYETNAMGARTGTNKYYSNVTNGVTIAEDVATIASNSVQSFTLVAGTQTGTYAIQFATDNYLSCSSIANNNLGTASTLSDICDLTISVSNGVSTLNPTKNSNNGSNKIQYNPSAPRFSNYKGGTQKDGTLYKKVTGGQTDPVAPGYKWMLGDQEVEDATVTIGANDNIFPTLYNPNGVTVTYSIEADAEVASIDATTGAITLINEGIAMVHAKSEATTKYLAGEATYMLTVNPKAVETKCATPTFSIPSGYVTKGTEVTVSCATSGAKLMLTVNNESIEWTEGDYVLTINENTEIKAHAELPGLESSDIAEASYLIKEQGDDPVEGTATFKASGATFEGDCVSFANNASGKLGDTQFVSGPITLAITMDSPSNEIYDAGGHVRWYAKNFITLTPSKNYKITEVYVHTVSNSKGNFNATVNNENAGTVSGTGEGASNPITWTGSVTAPLLLTPNAQIRFSYMTVKYAEDTSGIEDVTDADENAPVEYYNLQGIRVNNPENGIYIRRQGNTVTKVLVK